MSSREKAYFRKFASLHQREKNKNYFRLYQTIIDHPEIKVGELKNRFKGTSIYDYFSSEMNYLFKQLMKSLLNFHLDSNNSHRLLKLIFYIEILLEKGERKKAAKLLKQAKEMAYHYEDFTLVIKVIELEERALFRQGILNFKEQLEALEEERIIATDKINNLNRLRLLKEQIREFQYTHLYVNYPEKYPDTFGHQLLTDSTQALSKHALEIFYYLHCIMGYLERNYLKGVKASRVYLAFLEENEHLFREDIFLPAISNYLLVLGKLGAKEEFEKILEKLNGLAEKGTLDEHYIKYIRYCRCFELAYQLSDQQLARQILEESVYMLTKKNKFLFEGQKDYLFNFAIRCCIDLRDFKQAFSLINLWFEVGVQVFTTSVRRLSKMIIIYELGYFQLLEAEVQASYKVLKKRKKYERLEKTMISFFRKIAANPSREIKLLPKLYQELQSIKQNKDDNKHFDFVNYEKWCRERLTSIGWKNIKT